MEISEARKIMAKEDTATIASLAYGVESEEPLHDEDRDIVVAALTLLAHGRETGAFAFAADELSVFGDEEIVLFAALAGTSGEGEG